jgi:hypothetical protein
MAADTIVVTVGANDDEIDDSNGHDVPGGCRPDNCSGFTGAIEKRRFLERNFDEAGKEGHAYIGRVDRAQRAEIE